MPLICNWAKLAKQDLKQIHRSIAQDSPQRAMKVVRQITVQTESQLSLHPNLGHSGQCHDTRELVIAGLPYVVVYRAKENRIQTVAVMHQSQAWPEQFPD